MQRVTIFAYSLVDILTRYYLIQRVTITAFMAPSACHTRGILIAVTYFWPVFVQRRELSSVSEKGQSSGRIAAGVNRQVGRSKVVVWSSHGLRGCVRALDDRSAWSVIVDEVGVCAALCFTVGFFMSSCLLVLHSTARIDAGSVF